MSLLIVQLSDIHFRTKSDILLGRHEELVAAIRSIVPRPVACLLAITGDVAWSATVDEYRTAAGFFEKISLALRSHFQDEYREIFIPGNHDCYLPAEVTKLREALISGLESTIQTPAPDAMILESLLTAQSNFWAFLEDYTSSKYTTDDKICSTRTFNLGGKNVCLNSFNTALLTKRKELAGTLSLPFALLDRTISPASDADLVVAIYHHPDNWLEPNVRRSFRKLIETSSHLVLTGHEHDSDNRIVESSSGNQISYLEADALQDAVQSSRSAFNCLVIDFDSMTRSYWLFRWKGRSYSPVVAGENKPISLAKKSASVFAINDKFQHALLEDDFGFTHLRKPSLSLSDFFVYPTLEATVTRSDAKPLRVKSSDAFVYLLKERYILMQAADLSGKTALLKTLYNDLYRGTALVPVLMTEDDLTSSSVDSFFLKVSSAVRAQYSPNLVEDFRQLPFERRALLIDNWHKTRLSPDAKRTLLTAAKEFFFVIIASSSNSLSVDDFYSMEDNKVIEPLLKPVRIREFSASGRGAIIDKWMRIALPEGTEDHSLSREVEREQGIIDYLIGKKTLPSLPYLILGILQARQQQDQDMSDPGSFGFLVQRLVLDSLSLSKGKRKLMDRKEAVLRRLAYEMFRNGIASISPKDFEDICAAHASHMKITIESEAILADLIYGRVLTKIDGNLSFKYYHFYHYFLARHFIDEVEGPRAAQVREYLDGMADRPLTRSNQLTLIFFLFFKKRDPVIDRIIAQADATFADTPVSDMVSDTKFMNVMNPVLTVASVDTQVDTKLERQKRLERQDGIELNAEAEEAQISLDLHYDDSLEFQHRMQFATARLELLGQVIRNFPDSLEGEKKVEVLVAAFSLGLRFLNGTLKLLEDWFERGRKSIEEASLDGEARQKTQIAFKYLISLFVRACCDSKILEISRTVGVVDLEKAYAEAITKVGYFPSTRLVELAIKLDHSEGFPFRDVQDLRRDLLLPGNEVALAVLSDIVVRHTQIFKLKPETLRKIAGAIGVTTISLYDKDASN